MGDNDYKVKVLYYSADKAPCSIIVDNMMAAQHKRMELVANGCTFVGYEEMHK